MNRRRAALAAVSATAALMLCSIATATAAHAAVSLGQATETRDSARARCTISGTSGDDVLRGTPKDDVICGFGGDDRILGGKGDDVLIGHAGDDTLIGGAGDDTLIGGAGDDRLLGGPGRDTVTPGPGETPNAQVPGSPDPQPGAPLPDQECDASLGASGCSVPDPIAPPSPVQALTGTGTSTSSVRIQWAPPADAGTGAIIYSVAGSGSIAVSGTAADVTGLSAGANYTFAVTASNSAGAGTPATVEVATLAPASAPVVLVAEASDTGERKLTTTYNFDNDITARLQWNANSGYCGETSFITALMRQGGGYASQWTVRQLKLPAHGSQTNSNSQLMLGENGYGVPVGDFADAMRLTYTNYDGSGETDTDDFLAWVKEQVLKDDGARTVIIGVYNNVFMLGENTADGGAFRGDGTFDHIVPVVALGSNQPLTGSHASTYYAGDLITISDNGLYTPLVDDVPSNSPENPARSALYTFNVDDWQNYRAGANEPHTGGTTYDLYSAPIYTGQGSHQVQNFGTAVTGIKDTTPGGSVALHLDVTTSRDNEGFQDEATLSAAPTPLAMDLTVTAKPVHGTSYNVYMYDEFGDVPSGSFNTAATDAAQAPQWVIPEDNSGSWSQTISTTTDKTHIFRAVPVDAL